MRSCERSVAVASAEAAQVLPAPVGLQAATPPSVGMPCAVLAVSFASREELVPGVRHSVRSLVAIWGFEELTERLELLVSELAGNAVRHGHGLSVNILVKVQAGTALLEVEDASPAAPVVHEAGDDEECGRGLMLVGFLADDWGWRPTECGGKSVWASLAVPETGVAV